MNPLTFSGFLVFFLVFGRAALGEVVEVSPCSNEESQCEIHEVSIDPCREAPRGACKLKRGKSASVSFEFTPKFDSETATVQAYWTGGLVDAPLVGMKTNACDYTSCPLVQGTRKSFSYDLMISKMFPVSSYDVKWRVKGQNNEVCCFIFQIKLVK